MGCYLCVCGGGCSSVCVCVRGDSLIISSPEVQTSSLRQVMEDVTVKRDSTNLSTNSIHTLSVTHTAPAFAA